MLICIFWGIKWFHLRFISPIHISGFSLGLILAQLFILGSGSGENFVLSMLFSPLSYVCASGSVVFKIRPSED